MSFRWTRSLFAQLLVAVVAGVLVGHFWPEVAGHLKPIGDGFIRLIKMIIAPLVFCVVVTGIAAVGDIKAVGRIGFKAILYFEIVTTFALLFGLLVANVFQPGAGLDIDPATLDPKGVAAQTKGGQLPSIGDFLLHTIPDSVVNAFATNSLLQVLFFAVLFGVALAAIGKEKAPLVLGFVEQLQQVIFKVMGWVMRVAPLGAFGAMAFIIGQYGLGTLGTYAKLIAACYGAAVLFALILAVIARVYAGVPIWRFIRFAREEFLLALGTASTESVLPRIMAKLTEAGCSRAATGLVVPTGYSFNLDGATIYLSICTVFLAQAFGVDMSLGQQLVAIGILMLTSKGMAGVPGSSFLALSATAAAIGAFPVAGVALLLGADRLMDSMRVFVNLLGNCVATFVVAKSEKQLDQDRMRAVLGIAEAAPSTSRA
ncbi:aerobic C4-dicarboxylate transport protein [Amycolatopsis xylanica]|uniref:Aerobic C4-dicarboxylate transport protein n=1 Tax=Amycolatopsis xylanica TaxID=589385 RepID=A0A1H3R208_9PSEU|nr:C4-dicarboxylate transporter DctA [Amycolatopsis xylanica]SDZ19345.1 aerobic C4-dicarboxylate transport protein [Amycolatopsis xylanica]